MPTQIEIGAHLGLEQSVVSRHMSQLGIDWRTASMDEVRLAYIEHLRAVAAGRVDENARLLTLERIQTERAKRQNLMLELAKKSGQLVDAAKLEAAYARLVDACRAELLALPEKVVGDIHSMHGIDVDVELVNRYVLDALGELSGHASNDHDGDNPAVQEVRAPEADWLDEMGDDLSAPVGDELGEGGTL